MNKTIDTQYIGQNILESICKFNIPLEARHITGNVREELISYINENVNNKAYGVNYILNIDTASIKNELPLLALNNNIYTYNYQLQLPVKYLYFVKDQELKAYIDIYEDGENLKAIAYTKFLICYINIDNQYTINLTDRYITYKGKKYKSQDECFIRITDIVSSTGLDKVLGYAIIIDDYE
ncbi:putative RNA polymerase subunit [Alphaentomopoxvirus acuprea]|uniref:Putative RNA polymerase subunit n=1 Tax=Alphaentomopoxvirus acuprea TaxID=62099 RepID=W6JPJ8_9POXV|nr:putative RNA polymerase subunit [Anomala cuprea entomopoxvirus]BAO49404.1 putative RNA polymerase subunit [Anomala cuprea entomopoxvirus]